MATKFTRSRGDTYADEYVIRTPDTKAPIDITGYVFKMTLNKKERPADTTDQVYQLTGVILDGPQGRVEFAPTEAQADQVGEFYFDVQMVDGAGRKRTIDKGRYIYTQDITKD